MENNVIKVRVRNLYGNTLYYPVCDNAECFATIANTQTLTPMTIAKIKALGFVVMCEYAEGLSKAL